VEHERVSVGAEFGDDEGDLVFHQAADEVHVAAQPIELRHDYRRLGPPGGLKCSGELGPASVVILARLNLHERLDDLKALRLGEAVNHGLLFGNILAIKNTIPSVQQEGNEKNGPNGRITHQNIEAARAIEKSYHDCTREGAGTHFQSPVRVLN
jgi:hypothetical protein